MAVYKDGQRNTWYVSVGYKDYAGNTKRKVKRGFKTMREGKAWERDFLNSTAKSPKISFKLLSEIYIAYMEKRLKHSTAYNKTSHINSAILPYFKELEVADITPAIVHSWHDTLIETYAPSTQRIIAGILSSMMNYAVKYHGLKENPCKVAGSVGTLKRDKNSINFWTMDEFSKAMSFVETTSIDFVLFNLLYFSGMRIGELLALNIEDFHQQGGYIDITKTLDYTEGKNIITKPKTDSSIRKIYLPLKVCELLQKHIDSLSISGIYTANPSDKLFDIGISTIRRHLKELCSTADVKPIRIHDLRHSHASMLIELNTPPLAISERLGHDKVTTTLEIYSHLYPNKKENIINNLEKVYQNCITDKIKNAPNPIEQREKSRKEQTMEKE